MKIIEKKCFGGYLGWEQYALPKEIKHIQPDILHCTSNTAPIFCKTNLILTLHDIIFLEKQVHKNKSLYQKLGRLYRKIVVPIVIRKSKKIITVSSYEKNNIKDFLGLEEQKICFIHNGYSKHFVRKDNPEQVYKKYIHFENYIFFLGNTDPKKNTEKTILAYAEYVKNTNQDNINYLLVADLKEEIIDFIIKKNNIQWIKPYISAPNYIPNTDLPYIYSGAKAFLYTSLRESFGIPILESMACGCPIIASNTSAIPEIAGQNAILVDPNNVSEIASMIEKVVNNHEFRIKQIQYGLERVKEFSWTKSANELLKLYKEVLNK